MLARSLFHRPRPLRFALAGLALWGLGAWRLDASGELQRQREAAFARACGGLAGAPLAEVEGRLAPGPSPAERLAGADGRPWLFSGAAIPAAWARGGPALVAEYAFVRRYRLVPFNVPVHKLERRLCLVQAEGDKVASARLESHEDVL